MSTLETMLLPGVIQPRKDVTFVIKKSLLSYPCLGPVLSARKPMALGRKNAREDLKLVMEQGTQIINEGRSLIIFTQGTRRRNVDTSDFNSLAVKLAKKTHVPIIPIALKTDAWGEGNVLKDFGKINPAIPIHIRFGEPIYISASGKKEHEHILRFIKNQFNAWT